MQNAEFANSDICCFNKINGAAAKKVLLKKNTVHASQPYSTDRFALLLQLPV